MHTQQPLANNRLNPLTAVFYGMAPFAIYLLGRCPGVLTSSETTVLLLTTTTGALRTIIGKKAPSGPLAAAVAAAVLTLASIVAVAASPSAGSTDFPPAAAAAHCAGSTGRSVYPTGLYADWLSLARARTAWEVAFDARLELLTDPQFREISNGVRYGVGITTLGRRYCVFLLAQGDDAKMVRVLRARDYSVVYSGHGAVVLARRYG